MLNKILSILAGFVTLLLSSYTFGMQIYLKNGNVLVGELTETLPFSTPKLKLDIKTDQIISFERGCLRLKNGSTFEGAVIALEECLVQTKVGIIPLKAQEIEILQGVTPVATYNPSQNLINKYLEVTSEEGVSLDGLYLPKGTRLTVISEEGNQRKATVAGRTFTLLGDSEVMRHFKIEDFSTISLNPSSQKAVPTAATYNPAYETIDKYLVVTSEEGIHLEGLQLPKGTRLAVISEEGNYIKATVAGTTFSLPRDNELMRHFKKEDFSKPSSNPEVAKKRPKPLKRTVAVATLDNRVQIAGGGEYLLSRGLTDQFIHALIQSGQFTVLSRELFEEIAAEKELAITYNEMQDKNEWGTPWARILIKGSITEFDPGIEESSKSYTLLGTTSGSRKAKAHVGMIIYLVDTTTGQAIDSQRIEGWAEEGGATQEFNSQLLDAVFSRIFPYASAPNFSMRQETFKKAPLGKATQVCIDKAVTYISQRLAKEDWQGRVVQVKGKKVYINAGNSTGIKRGMEFDVCQGENLSDPHSGVKLGTALESVGKLKVIKAHPAFAECFLIDGYEPKPGDVVTQPGTTGVSEFLEEGAIDKSDKDIWEKLESLSQQKEEGEISEEKYKEKLEELVSQE